jgi:hypothetical protein
VGDGVIGRHHLRDPSHPPVVGAARGSLPEDLCQTYKL